MFLKHAIWVLTALMPAVFQQPISVNVSVVTVGVRVTDSRGRDVVGLQRENFSLFEDGNLRDIAFFSGETQPIALGILLDSSSSMGTNGKMDRAKEAARALTHGTLEGSEFFYIDFDDQVKVVSGFTDQREVVMSAIEQTTADGGTSLYDALLEGLVLTGQARRPRQALVIVSDGADQHSTHSLEEVSDIVRESQIQIYTIGYFSEEEERMFRTSGPKMSLINGQEVDNPRLALQDIARQSGGESYFPKSDKELAEAVAKINEDLRTQYTLSFYPADPGSQVYHELQVKVSEGRYNVRARPGYGTREFEPGSRRDVSRASEGNVPRENGLRVYTDDFSEPTFGWPQRANAQYRDGGYRLTGEDVVVTNGLVFRNFRATVSFVMEKSEDLADSLPRVGTQQLPTTMPEPPVGSGLLFRQSPEGFYALLVFPASGRSDGFAALVQTEGLSLKELRRWPLARAGPTHTVTVECSGEACTLFADGRMLGQLEKSAYAEGSLGLALSGRGQVVFDNFSVEELR